jgi:hypothetical protein
MTVEVVLLPSDRFAEIAGPVHDVLAPYLFVRVTKGEKVTIHCLGYRQSDGVPYITSDIIAGSVYRVRTKSCHVYVISRQLGAPDLPLEAHLLWALSVWGVEP